jgi:hypothetical protein
MTPGIRRCSLVVVVSVVHPALLFYFLDVIYF